MNSNRFFETAAPKKLFFRVALPGLISMLAMSVYTVIEGIFVGQWLGEAAFAAINIAMPFVMINFSLADLVGVGSSVQISIALGRQDKERANNIFTSSLFMIFCAALFMGTVLFAGAPALVRALGADGNLAVYAVKYVRVYALFGPVTTVMFAMDNYLRISGFVKYSMVLNIGMSVMTAGLLALFLGVFGLNVDGSALATSTSMFICVVVAVLPFVAKKTVLKFTRPHITFEIVKKIVLCGAPVFLNNVAGRVAAIIMNIFLIKIGGQTAVAAYSVLMYAGEIINPMMYGLCDSVQPAVGYNWGARNFERVRDISKCSFVSCGVVSVVGAVAMMALPEVVTNMFVKPGEKELLEVSCRALVLYGMGFVFRWFGFAVQSFFSAIEKPSWATVLSISNALVFPVLLIFALYPMGLDGLWLNFTGTSLLTLLLALFMQLKMQKRLKYDI